jgi:hypothetical protein
MDVEGVEYIDLVRPSLQTKKGRYRQLLLFRSRIYELWPQDKTSAKVKAGSYKNGQSPPTEEEILKVVRELYEVTDPPPNIVKAEQLVRAKLPTAKREQIKATLKTPEFSQKRRPPGNQKKAR